MFLAMDNYIRHSLPDVLDDAVLLAVLLHLPSADAVRLVGSCAASLAGRLGARGDSTGNGCCVIGDKGAPCGSTQPGSSVVRRLVHARLGKESADEVAAVAAAAMVSAVRQPKKDDAMGYLQVEVEEDEEEASALTPTVIEEDRRQGFLNSGYFIALRAVAGAQPMGETLRAGLELSQSPDGADARRFLLAFFRGECRLRSSTPASGAVSVASVANAVLMRLIRSRPFLIRAAAAALREAELCLDGLYEGVSKPSCYEAIAKQRSAAEFLLCRLKAGGRAFGHEGDSVGGCIGDCTCADVSEVAAAAESLKAAAAALDETIKGCAADGFELIRPRFLQGAPPGHWWLFIGGCCPGNYGMCG